MNGDHLGLFSSMQPEFSRTDMCFAEFLYCANAVFSEGFMQVRDAMRVLWVCFSPEPDLSLVLKR